MKLYPDLEYAIKGMGRTLLNTGKIVDLGSWHSQESKYRMLESLFCGFTCPMVMTVEDLNDLVEANQPWAEQHFLERVSGIPMNPPPSHKLWPYAKSENGIHLSSGKFSHTYPERFWPKQAGDPGRLNYGIRYEYGDLNSVIDLLLRDPSTRQAYLPIWFPEDTGAESKQRVPCSLGYHFMMRDGYLNMAYFMRSCDYIRHFRDDVYHAVRLAQHICIKLNTKNPTQFIIPGYINMFISNLHIFSHEQAIVKKIIDGNPPEAIPR